MEENCGENHKTVEENCGKNESDLKSNLKSDTINVNDTINDTTNDTLNDTIKQTDVELKVLEQIKNDCFITREMLVKKTMLSGSTIARALKSLQEKNVIKRIGAKKNGHWEIIPK